MGEHYSLFSQVIQSHRPSIEHVQKGLKEQISWMEEHGYDKEYIFLTATNPPQYDNNPPDWRLPELIQEYNETYKEYKIRFVTAQQLYERLLLEEQKNQLHVPVYRGDWTDYWNFGCASTARETRVNRLAKDTLEAAEMLECFHLKKDRHYQKAKQECQENILFYDEHTWGASGSVAYPNAAETVSQLVHKWNMAYTAGDLAGYLLSRQMEKMAANPYQSDKLEGICLVNPTSEEQTCEVVYPKLYRKEDRHISTKRSKQFIPYLESCDEMIHDGIITMPPFSVKKMSFEDLDLLSQESSVYQYTYDVNDSGFTTPYYTVQLCQESGEIRQIQEKATQRKVISSGRYHFFEPIVERIDDTDQSCTRETLFGDSVFLRNHNISQWNHEWKPKYGRFHLSSWHVEEAEYHIAIVREGWLDGIRKMEQKIIFYTYRPQIRMEIIMEKEAVEEPESLLFAIPLKLNKGWNCRYDTAGEVVSLDEEQLGKVCRDYVTVDTAVSMYDSELCVTLACPDAPMVQVGNFNFGRERYQIPREENPLLLAWPMNNYWTTNFMANQSGTMTFSYELAIHSSYDQKEMRRDGIGAKKPVKVDALVKAEGTESQLLHCQGNSAVLGVFPSKESEGILVLLKNQRDEADTMVLSVPVWNIQNAYQVTPQERKMEELNIVDSTVQIIMPPRALKLIKLYKES